MGQALPAGIPTFIETGWTRESLLDALRNQRELPVDAVNIALRFPAEIEDAVAAVLRRGMSEKLDQPSDRLLFRGIHILGAARCSTIYRPLIDFLRGPEDIIEDLGDATTETVSQILAGVFDGDSSLLKGLITDVKADEYVRNAAFGALAFLTFEDRIARDDTADFLRRFAEEDTSPAASLAWDGWMAAVGLLGLDELTPRVLAAFADDRIPSYMSEEKHYRELLEQALRHPIDPQRFRNEHLGYLEDTADELARFFFDPEEATTPAGTKRDRDSARESDVAVKPTSSRMVLALEHVTSAHNPFKGVGRNDPCPCASGKKFKKCCGAAG